MKLKSLTITFAGLLVVGMMVMGLGIFVVVHFITKYW